jgi:hypothetical protein
MKTKKFVLPLAAVIVVLAIVLVACGAKATATTTSGGTTGGSSGGSGGFAANGTPGARNLTQPLPLAESLLIGTLKLQGTSNAINATQAAALVPLWQAYAQLTSSNTAAQAEIDAVVTQIQQTMTPAQVQAITAMKLTRQDMFTEMSSLGLTNGGANGTPGFSFTPRAGGGTGGGARWVVAVAVLRRWRWWRRRLPGWRRSLVVALVRHPADPEPTQIALRAQFANRIPTP